MKDTITFHQAAEGTLLDGAGNAAWHLDIDYSGWASRDSGGITVQFLLRTPEGGYAYQGGANLASASEQSNGTVVTFTGSYERVGGPDGGEDMPKSGTLEAVLTWWLDGTTLYAVDIRLEEG